MKTDRIFAGISRRGRLTASLALLGVAVALLTARAGQPATNQVITVQTVASAQANAPRKASPPSAKPVEVGGLVKITLDKKPGAKDIQTERFSVEFYVDDQLQLTTKGATDPDNGQPAFVWIMDTAKFANGEHKLVVNLWDRDGPAAIGIKRLIVRNPGTTQP